MKIERRRIFFTISACLLVGCGFIGYRHQNELAVEKLRQRIIAEQFDEIYLEASIDTRKGIARDDFVGQMRSITSVLKGIDSEIKWGPDITCSYDPSVFRDDNFSSRDLSGNGKKINVELEWADFRLCSMHVFQI
ncbi:MAG: hypothetical protein IPP63_13720 [Chloracidobacterium sp.]|nr:hypothetical protein [Chloracidobacterium sp.]